MPVTLPLRRLFAASCLVTALLLVRAPAGAAPGDLDPSFDGDGIVTGSAGGATALALQSDGKIVAAEPGFSVQRWHSNGALDTGFGTSGTATPDFGPSGATATDVLVAPGGAIVVVGKAPPAAAVAQVAIARFDASGALDPTFGTGGTTVTSLPVGLNDHLPRVLRLPSGRLVVGASSGVSIGTQGLLVAFDDSGALDAGFGSGGVVLTNEPSSIDALAVSGDEIVAVGLSGTGGVALARFAFDGTPGAVTTLPDASTYFPTDLAIDGIGRAVVVGGTGYCADTFAARFGADGKLDDDFGVDGVTVLNVSPTDCSDLAEAVALQPDGRILMTTQGWTFDAPPSIATLSTWWLVRLDSDGTLDPTFGGDGSVLVQEAAPNAMVLQPDGKVVTGGYVETLFFEPPVIGVTDSLVLARNEATTPPLCTAAPRGDCAAAPPKGTALKLTRPAGKNPSLHWSWKKGTAVAADFGDPTVGGQFALCLYDGGNALVGAAQVDGDGLCAGKPCWKATGTSGWQYKDKRGTVYGIDKLKLKIGSGKAAIDVQGKHGNLPVVPLPSTLPLRVQLQTSAGSCFGAVYGTATKNDAKNFAAKN